MMVEIYRIFLESNANVIKLKLILRFTLATLERLLTDVLNLVFERLNDHAILLLSVNVVLLLTLHGHL